MEHSELKFIHSSLIYKDQNVPQMAMGLKFTFEVHNEAA